MCLVVHCPSNAGTVGQFGTTVAPVAPRNMTFSRLIGARMVGWNQIPNRLR